MRRGAVAWVVGIGGMSIAACTAIGGLDKSYQEVDCFPPGTCADGSVDGWVDGRASDGSTQGDATQGPEGGKDVAAADGDAGTTPETGIVDTGVVETGDDGGPGSDASDGGGCPSADLVCDGGCVANDSRNCGACGHDCTNLPHVSGAVSCGTGGACSFPPSACATGWMHCSANPDLGCETNVATTSNCGSCGNACSGSTPVCTASGATYQCASGCPAATPTLCSGSCVDTSSNAGNCKSCGNVCTTNVAHAQATCVGSTCGIACNSGYTSCNGACVDETSDNGNCGGCGSAFACAGGKQCVASACVCPSGTHQCGASCVPNDVNACGASCTVCAPPTHGTATCNGTSCGFTCSNPYTSCAGACVNEAVDNGNCGGCGSTFACATGATCTNGVCQCPTGDLLCGGACAACSTPQNGTPVCNGSACSYTCGGVYTSCAGGCWNTTNDTQHCGSSCAPCAALDVCHQAGTCSGGACSNPVQTNGTPCGTNASCQGGTCTCTSGYTSCPSGCSLESSDNSNCGSCGHVCPALSSPSQGASCGGGLCVGYVGGYQNGTGLHPGVDSSHIYAVAVTVPQLAELVSLNVEVTGGGGATNVTLGLYSDNGGTPGTLLHESTTSVSGVGLATVNLSAQLPAPTYWIALAGSFTPPSSNVNLSGPVTCVEGLFPYQSFLPATFPAVSGSCGNMGLYLVADF